MILRIYYDIKVIGYLVVFVEQRAFSVVCYDINVRVGYWAVGFEPSLSGVCGPGKLAPVLHTKYA